MLLIMLFGSCLVSSGEPWGMGACPVGGACAFLLLYLETGPCHGGHCSEISVALSCQ